MKDRIIKYRGKDILVHFGVDRCTHVAECVRGLPSVFAPSRRPWILPDLAEAERVAEVILRCPTGALHFKRRDGGWEESPPKQNEIAVAFHGPLYIRGDLHLFSSDGDVLLEDTRIALCRCGQSKNMPLCDGTHFHADFRDPGNISPQKGGSPAPVREENTLKITVEPNGPYGVSGSFILKNNKGQVGFQGTRTAFCSCGKSQNKPFCDGSHAR